MILEFLLALAAGLTVILLLTVAQAAIKSKIALTKYKKQLRNVPFDDEDADWFSNHFFKLAMNNNCKRLHERHQKYGDTFAGMCFERPMIVTADLDLIKRALIDDASVNINRLNFKLPIKEFENDCILFAEDEQWRRIRKSFAPALKPRYFKAPNVVHEIETTVGKLIEAIEEQLKRHEQQQQQRRPESAKRAADESEEEAEFNVDNLMHRFSMNVVMSCFYKQYNIVNFDLSQNCDWVDMVEFGISEVQNNPVFTFGMIVPAVRHVIDFIVYHLHPMGRWRRDVMQFLKIQAKIGLEARKHLEELKHGHAKGHGALDVNNFILKDGTKFNRNIIDYIVDQLHSGEISKAEFFNSSAFLFNAADKTASDVLVFTLYQLAINQDIQEKLRQSIRAQGSESEYLDWVINESLRLHPPVPGGPTRTLSRPVKLKEGDTLQAGTFVLTSLYTIHRLPQYWGPDAEEFKPERWAEAHTFHPAQFMPFGAGLRRCLGREFALFEIKTLLCALLDRYRFGCRENRRGPYGFDAPLMIFVLHHSPFYLTISRL